MSQENVEIVRRLYESGAMDGNYAALLELLDPDAVFVNPPEAVDPGTRRGVNEIMAAAESVAKSFGATEHKPRKLFDAGDAVVASITANAWGRDSGAQVTQ